MTESSYFWGGTVTGDATIAPYADDEFSDVFRALLQTERTTEGVIYQFVNELAITGAATPISMNTGAAMVDGKYYYNDAALAIAIPTPAVANRYDRIVLRKDFAAQTVRATRIAGVEGGGIPALTQVDYVTWDIPLYTVYVTTGGVITLTDNRYFLNTPLANFANITEGRLTLTTGSPISGNVTGQATLYFTPYKGNKISLYANSRWRVFPFSEVSITIVGCLATTVYDVFIYDNDGVLTLELVAWATATTRATAIVSVDGVYVKSGSSNKKYLGTIYTELADECDDSNARRHVWNYYNRVQRFFSCSDATNSWNYTTATWRQANNDTTVGTNRITYVGGVSTEVQVNAYNQCVYSNTGAWSAAVGIGYDSTSADSCTNIKGNMGGAGEYGLLRAELAPLVSGIGYHYLQRIEISVAAGTGTFYGDNGLTYVDGGMQGWIMA